MNKIKLLAIILVLSVSVFAGETLKLVILHTNDTHSQVDPTAKGKQKTSDMGGYARRMGVIEKVRSEEKNVLLLDAGDFSQGTPYFNFYNGRIEIDALNKMQYDAGTLGNHEFDNGTDTLAMVLSRAAFPILSSNYDLFFTPLAPYVKPYVILKKAGLKIGVMALNIKLDGMVMQNNFKGLIYNDPIKTAQKTSTYLKKEKKCDLVICLSHLGSDTTDVNLELTDYDVIRQTKDIDIIIAGHSHEVIENTKVKNAAGKEVILAQMGKSGLLLGRIDLYLEKKKK
jgi:5'-nucleotidase